MAKFGHTLIFGIVWIVVDIGIGFFGLWLTTQSGLSPILGWPIAIIGFGLAGISARHLWRITSLQMQGIRMMRDDLEGFEEIKRRYEEAKGPIDFDGSKTDSNNMKLISLLDGMLQPLQQGAVQQIDNAIQHIQDGNSKGRFMLLMIHVCLASVLHRLDHNGQSRLSSSFKDLAISKWYRPPNRTIHSDLKLFTYSQQLLGDTLENPKHNQLEYVGLTLLSMACLEQEQFSTEAAFACGQAAHACWQQASVITQNVMKR